MEQEHHSTTDCQRDNTSKRAAAEKAGFRGEKIPKRPTLKKRWTREGQTGAVEWVPERPYLSVPESTVPLFSVSFHVAESYGSVVGSASEQGQMRIPMVGLHVMTRLGTDGRLTPPVTSSFVLRKTRTSFTCVVMANNSEKGDAKQPEGSSTSNNQQKVQLAPTQTNVGEQGVLTEKQTGWLEAQFEVKTGPNKCFVLRKKPAPPPRPATRPVQPVADKVPTPPLSPNSMTRAAYEASLKTSSELQEMNKMLSSIAELLKKNIELQLQTQDGHVSQGQAEEDSELHDRTEGSSVIDENNQRVRLINPFHQQQQQKQQTGDVEDWDAEIERAEKEKTNVSSTNNIPAEKREHVLSHALGNTPALPSLSMSREFVVSNPVNTSTPHQVTGKRTMSVSPRSDSGTALHAQTQNQH
ncbi:uncharacterized protein LOC117180426 [Belonocnema kinseyi]|uniref:uncharacterized protein LOC117180426 n=1 Tax=Belonocnema kinseyi TaxID=2817044 RepID=UPI00143DB9D0|nr:uncharacterized protein LOC117180426 [Belonocnema kinseyi]